MRRFACTDVTEWHLLCRMAGSFPVIGKLQQT